MRARDARLAAEAACCRDVLENFHYVPADEFCDEHGCGAACDAEYAALKALRDDLARVDHATDPKEDHP